MISLKANNKECKRKLKHNDFPNKKTPSNQKVFFYIKFDSPLYEGTKA